MILVLNCGSQSIKWKLFNDKLKIVKEGKKGGFDKDSFGATLDQEIKNIAGSDPAITVVGHRVVHGGGKFSAPAEITGENLAALEEISHLAPLHNPYNVAGIKMCAEIFPQAKQIAVFDTEFFGQLPEVSSAYALPENIAKEFGFKRYGFHGTSHEYVAKKASEQLKKPFDKLKIISCHLGGGASVAAIKDGKAIDASMGFTPMEGLVMMTRAGNIDAGIVLQMARTYGIDRTEEILNKESGVKGVCGDGDMLSVLEKIENGGEKARLALDIFAYSIKKYIGAYFAILGGCDALVFTGAIGFGSEKIRNMVCEGMDILNGAEVLAIETDEELAIAQKISKI